MNLSQYVSTKEAAEELGCSRQQVSALCKRGILDCVLITPRAYLVLKTSIEAYKMADCRKYGRKKAA